ncbi:MAG: sigma-70 family RNA polymerase sigma factor [Lachnospiraceae bacterium]|nr:sigma-70 family RNA polymerase sigma factor [Lachnospiraceae bacterium]MBO5354050.1 sigma-70 family RNA polymerase sigma factor [Lachnospiraceae bacterium]MBP3567903.1 sigma-70 family RNA polymerase sigma factor [Lachnospiraceae bacterium]
MGIMTKKEQRLVEEHLELVNRIVRGTMSINENIQGLGYEDLYQTGCEALCKAAVTYREDRGASFVTFADVVIKNSLLSHCRKISRIQAPLSYLDAPVADNENITYGDVLCAKEEHGISDRETDFMLDQMEQQFTGIAKKGIAALRLRYQGHDGDEIARHFGVKPNHVSAWVSRALQKMRTEYAA